VREHRLTGDVANGEDRGLAAAALLIDIDEAVVFHLHPGHLQAEIRRVRPAPRRNQNAVVFTRFLALSARELRRDAGAALANAGLTRFEAARGLREPSP